MRIERLRLLSPDPDALGAFYRTAFGARASGAGVAIGAERIEIAQGSACGTFAGNETGFQHFAIVVTDIEAAYAHLHGVAGWRPISGAGPERLPAASGGASAFKFRDPDGHPLELLQFPSPSPLWAARFAAAPELMFHGVDHTGLTVSDAERSLVFYAALGFTRRSHQMNVGVEQARLDGLPGAQVAITSLSPPEGERPGIELLDYLTPATAARVATDGSAAATEMVIVGSGEAADPDGHRLVYVGG